MPRLEFAVNGLDGASNINDSQARGFSDDSWPGALHGSARQLGKDPTSREPARELQGPALALFALGC